MAKAKHKPTTKNTNKNQPTPPASPAATTSTTHNNNSAASEIVANISTPQGTVALNAQQFGLYVRDKYLSLHPFMFAQSFIDYRSQHFMAELVTKLKAGMDEVSCDYVEFMERLYDLLPLLPHILLARDQAMTATDRQLLEHCQKLTAAGTPPFLKQVDMGWRTSYTSWYGLYDTDKQQLQRVNGKAVLDVGAYIGDTLVLFRELFPQSPLYGFEPSSDSFHQMCSLLKDDIASGRVHPLQKGVGAKRSMMSLNHTRAGAGAFSLLDVPYPAPEKEEIEVVTIDDFVAENNLQVGLIKADVEGFEPEVVRGALNTIKTQKPLLILSTYHTAEEYYELKPYLESLDLGYTFRLRRSSFITPYGDLVVIATPKL